MDVIRKFDPWEDPLCTCPKKLGFNPYTGCGFRCVYCYVSSYIPRAFECRPKKNLIARVERDLKKANSSLVISMSNSSDPYPPMEEELRITRACLEVFLRENRRIQIITKSDLVVRDIDLLRKMKCAVSFTVTTLDNELSKKLEPMAPLPKKRLTAMKKISASGIPTSLRLDPIIPHLNDEEIEEIVNAAAEHGASHITSSTFKPRPDSWLRMKKIFPKIAEKLEPLYFKMGTKHHNSWYLPKRLRATIMETVREACEKNNITFASCREGMPELTTGATCDGSHLIKN